MNNIFNLGSYGSFNTSRICKFIKAKDKHAATYMGPWDKLKDFFRNNDAKKIARLEKLWNRLHEGADSAITSVEVFITMAEIANNDNNNPIIFSIKKVKSSIIAAPVNVHFQINDKIILSLPCDKEQFYKLQLNKLNFNESSIYTIPIASKSFYFNSSESEFNTVEDKQKNYLLYLDSNNKIVKIKHWSENIPEAIRLTDKNYQDKNLFRFKTTNPEVAQPLYYYIKGIGKNKYTVLECKPRKKLGKQLLSHQGRLSKVFRYDQYNITHEDILRKIYKDELANKTVFKDYSLAVKYFDRCQTKLDKSDPDHAPCFIIPTLKNSSMLKTAESVKEVMPFISGTKPVLALNKKDLERSQKLFLKMFNLTMIGQKNGLFCIDNKLDNWIYDKTTDQLYRIDLSSDVICLLNCSCAIGTNHGLLGFFNRRPDPRQNHLNHINGIVDWGNNPIPYMILKRIQSLVELTLHFMDVQAFMKLKINRNCGIDTLSKRLSDRLAEVLPKEILPFDRSEFIQLVTAWAFTQHDNAMQLYSNYEVKNDYPTIKKFMNKYYDQNTGLPKF